MAVWCSEAPTQQQHAHDEGQQPEELGPAAVHQDAGHLQGGHDAVGTDCLPGYSSTTGTQHVRSMACMLDILTEC